MAGSTFFVAFVFAVAVGRVAKGCDPNHCCCPNGQVSAVQVGTGVTFTYNVASGSTCLLTQVISVCQVSGNACSVDNSDFNFAATKGGDDVTVTDRSDARCSLALRCTTDSCKSINIWTGQYTVTDPNTVETVVPPVSTGTGACDPNHCCCPNGQVSAVQVGTGVIFTYNVASGSTCLLTQVISVCQVSGNVCSVDNSDFNFAATKGGDDVTVTDRNDASCSLALRCTTDGCKSMNTWTGQYTVTDPNTVETVVPPVSRGTGACDPNNCCCPDGQVNALQAGTTSVTFSYNVASGSGCSFTQVIAGCQLSGSVCSVSNSQFNFAADKRGSDVTVSDRNDASCSLELRCTTNGCQTSDNWSGQYKLVGSGSKTIVFPATCLLVAALSGMLI